MAVTFPLSGRFRDLHPLEYVRAGRTDAAIIPDLGMLASADPVALDKAGADLVIQAPVLHSDNVLAKKHEHEDLCGCDKFHMIHPDTDWLAGLRHAEKISLGTMDYELIKI